MCCPLQSAGDLPAKKSVVVPTGYLLVLSVGLGPELYSYYNQYWFGVHRVETLASTSCLLWALWLIFEMHLNSEEVNAEPVLRASSVCIPTSNSKTQLQRN